MSRKKSDNPLTDPVPVRLQSDVRADLQAEADDRGCPLSTLLRMIAKDHRDRRVREGA